MKRKLTSILLALVMVLALLPFGAATAEAATSGSCGSGVTWKLDNGTLTISGKGAMTDFTDENLPPWLDDSESVTKIVVSSGVTRIGDVAFIMCSNATSVSIASSVTEIGEGAFSYCYGLESITLPGGLKKIGSMAFFGCISVTSMRVPASVTEIGTAAFSCCGAMTGFQVDSGNAYYSADGRALFNKDKTRFLEYCAQAHPTYTIPSTVKNIASNSIYGWLNMTRVTIPASVTTVEFDAFVSNTAMTTLVVDSGNPNYATDGKALMNKDKTKIIEFCAEATTRYTVPSTVKTIGEYAFANCSKLYRVEIPDTVTTMGEGAFFNCTGLTEVELSDNLQRLEDGVFYNCSKLVMIHMPKKLVSVGVAAFYGCREMCNGPSFPATLKSIGDGAFYGASFYQMWFFGHKPSIGTNAFYGVTTQAYYPPEDSTWTDMGQYGGEIEWIYMLTYLSQPEDVIAPVGATAVFTARAGGSRVHYQWYWMPAGECDGEVCTFPGAKTDTLEVPVTADINGAKFYCVTYDDYFEDTLSETATLYVKTDITAQPKNASGKVGDTAKFTVKATGAGLTYQWQYKTATGTNWLKCSMTGNKTATLSVPVTAARNDYQYRCVITDANGKKTYSNAAKLTVKTAITAQPADKSAAVGDTAKFTVKATGAGLTYQWQYKTATGTNWLKCSMEGNQTKTLSVPVTAARNGYQYRCVITDANGKKTYSDAAMLWVKTVITAQPQNVTAAAGDTAKFTVKASGVGLTYQWQYKTATGTNWLSCSMEGNQTKTLSVPVTNARNGYQYRCVVTDGNDVRTISDAAALTVE